MQRNFYTDEFEQLVRQKADQYKMYPSDHVWKGVHNALHGRRRWYWAGMAVLLLGAGIFSADYLLNREPLNRIAKEMQPSLTAVELTQATGTPNTSLITSGSKPSNISSERAGKDAYTIPAKVSIEYTRPLVNVMESGATSAQPGYTNSDRSPSKASITLNPLSSFKSSILAAPEFADAASESMMRTGEQVNWLEEYAVYQLGATRAKKIGWMLHFSPTINYRKLTGSGTVYSPASEIQSVPLALSFNGAVDQYVHHKPALGFELGSNFLYRTSKHVQFKAGIQFNYSRYNIEAYSSHPEKATIALDPYWNGDTIVTYTSVRNMSGYAQQELANQYFEISVPVGIEVRLFGNEKLQLDVAGTLQPTYLLNKNSYLITTDYKNYTREPSLVRRWNVNAGVETYVAYNTGTVRWQLGPQFRYQLFSTYANKYPIKEYLMEYGFKIGVSKTIR
jgi:hypothetical protein